MGAAADWYDEYLTGWIVGRLKLSARMYVLCIVWQILVMDGVHACR